MKINQIIVWSWKLRIARSWFTAAQILVNLKRELSCKGSSKSDPWLGKGGNTSFHNFSTKA